MIVASSDVETNLVNSPKVCIIGLDCAAPELIFELWPDRLPNLRRIMTQGIYGPLESTTPPITVPAWMCMMTGKDPGTLGIYGFRNRRDHSYEGLSFASSRMVQEPALWDVLAEHGKRTIALGVPLTYPPRPINGLMVTDFLAPNTDSEYTYPKELAAEIKAVVGDYILDTREFRTEDKARLLDDIYTMTAQRFQLARHLLTTKPWDLFVMVEMGPDRLHHAFWKYFDPLHPKYVPGNSYENAIRDYYVALDVQIGELLEALDEGTQVLIVSDHGAKRMDGGLCFNQWLIQEGYLILKAEALPNTKFSPALVDWSRTRAWGDGGYYGRLFLNVQGREPHGIVAPEQVEMLKQELTAKLESLTDPVGRPLGSKVFRPENLYVACRNVAPDLIVYFGDLHWRSVGSVGHASIWTHENDTGPDDANHAQFGIFMMTTITRENRGKAVNANSKAEESEEGDYLPNRREDLSLYDVAPTVLTALGIAPPTGMGRHVISHSSLSADIPSTNRRDYDAYSEEEEAELARRLEDLGYL